MKEMKPSALQQLDAIRARLRSRQVAMFLDFDGTLAPIVERPELAAIDAPTRAVVERLARTCPVAVVSGRDLADVAVRVGVEGITYAGSHGFDIAGPRGSHRTHQKGVEAVPALDAAEAMLRDALAAVEGSQIERKKFSLAVHYRRVRENEVAAVEAAVDRALRQSAGLRKGRGKKVFELQPDVDWDKGAAVRWLLQALQLEGPQVLPVYIGDDVTDEDAFRALAGWGLTFVVQGDARPTAAEYRLEDPREVRALLEQLAAMLEQSG